MIIRRLDLRNDAERALLHREWLATNGLGGYASATVAGSVTWRYHGLLIAALPAPLGRTVMLSQVDESAVVEGQELKLSGEDAPELGNVAGEGCPYLVEFRLEDSLPVWRVEVGGYVLEKSVLFLHGQNTVHLSYHLLSGPGDLRLRLRPALQFRRHEDAVDEAPASPYRFVAVGQRYEIENSAWAPTLRMKVWAKASEFRYDGGTRREVLYVKEAERGYPSRGVLWSPGYFELCLSPAGKATLVASTEEWHKLEALNPEQALRFYQDRHERLVKQADVAVQDGPAGDLVLAADQFVIIPAGRVQDAARAHAAGDDIRTVIAGYHWFTDWGRDTMISLEGLTLVTNRWQEAGWILRTFAHSMRDGLIPNLFPEGESQGLYHTADATLWFFHALDRYVGRTGDIGTLRLLLPKLRESIQHHIDGTRFGIGVDPADGLLKQGEAGYQLTWMDAKVDGWVVTPRRGKAVEINGLWYNALRLMQRWLNEIEGEGSGARFGEMAVKMKEAFNRKFWNEGAGFLYDVIEGETGNESACRPNQLLAFSLPHPVLEEGYQEPVLEAVKTRLLTPFGLRSLSPDHPDYKPKYFGDLRARDAAYHQGTVWAWLIGPFIDAWLRVHPNDNEGARGFLEGFIAHLDEGCVGSVNEVFDAEPPFTPRGCIAQAWSVAEILRCWAKTQTGNGG